MGVGWCITADNKFADALYFQIYKEYTADTDENIAECQSVCSDLGQDNCVAIEWRPNLITMCNIYTKVKVTAPTSDWTVSRTVPAGDQSAIAKGDGTSGTCYRYKVEDVISAVTNSPTSNPTKVPTAEPSASSHGDPIIWTFKGECYDLSLDGFYLASSHPTYNHKVWVGVYNEFIREIQITDEMDTLLFAISNLDELSGEWNYGLKEWTRICTSMSWKECEWNFKQYAFDAQIFRYTVQIMFHDYLDAALKEGERGIHLDIYPKVYEKRLLEFHPSEYNGIYFDNPHPDQLHFCPVDSPRRS